LTQPGPSGSIAREDERMSDDTTRAVELVEATIRSLGVDPAAAKIPGDDKTRAYALRRGSARVVVAVARGEGGAGTLRVLAPVVHAPEVAKEAAVFRRLLELNAREVSGAAFGLFGDEIVAVAERATKDLDASEVDAIVKNVGRVADRWDDVLAKEFGLKRASDA
jgi:hypothetical protein